MSDESVYIVYIEISVISNVLTLTNIWKACRKRLNWHTHFQDKSLSRFQPSSESPRRFFYSVVFYGKDGTDSYVGILGPIAMTSNFGVQTP